jgi:hypothetical protein
MAKQAIGQSVNLAPFLQGLLGSLIASSFIWWLQSKVTIQETSEEEPGNGSITRKRED